MSSPNHHPTSKIAKYAVYDILQNRFVAAYCLFLLAISMTFFNLENNPSKGLASLLNVILIVTPLVSIIFTTIHLYNSAEFIELLLAQPLRRRDILNGEFTGVSVALSLAFVAGVGIPVLLYDGSRQGGGLVAGGALLNLVFIALAFWAHVIARDKARGIGLALFIWFLTGIAYDGLVMTAMFAFSDYPLEKAIIALSFLNPVDLTRIAMLMQLDSPALMGYTGAVFQQFFGSMTGIVVSLAALLIWIALPFGLARRMFARKDC